MTREEIRAAALAAAVRLPVTTTGGRPDIEQVIGRAQRFEQYVVSGK